MQAADCRNSNEDVSKSILQYMKDISCDEDDVLAADVKKNP